MKPDPSRRGGWSGGPIQTLPGDRRWLWACVLVALVAIGGFVALVAALP